MVFTWYGRLIKKKLHGTNILMQGGRWKKDKDRTRTIHTCMSGENGGKHTTCQNNGIGFRELYESSAY